MRSKPAALPGVFKYRKMEQLAKQRGLTNRALAAAVQANQGTVVRWVKGEAAPSPKFIARLAEVLGVPPSELYEVSEMDRNLGYYRVLAGYSLAQLAPLVGTSSVHLGRMEAGRSIVPEHIRGKLQEHLNLDEEKMERAMRRSQTRRQTRRRGEYSRPFEFVPATAPVTTASHLIGA